MAEQPELHLLPHIEAWRARDGRLALARASDAAFESHGHVVLINVAG